MGNPDLLNLDQRKRVIEEINQEENHSRKREHQKRFDVYQERQDRYILERLLREFDTDTVNQMRKIFSINLTQRLIDELSSIYQKPVERNFSSKDGRELSEEEISQLNALYKVCHVNNELSKANRFYNLHDQCALMVVPNKMGSIKVKTISPVHYDVIPDAEDQEKAYAYILNVWDKDLYMSTRSVDQEPTQLNRYRMNDRINQTIADDNDRKKEHERYVVWTDEVHFTMDGNGKTIGEEIVNPIGKIPFIDIAHDKDFQFFVRRGTSVCDFALDLGLVLSDTANTIRLQSYAQAVMKSEKPPQNMVVGPNNILWLPIDPETGNSSAEFQFVSPNPDIQGGLDFVEVMINLFLSSRGIDPGTVSGQSQAKSFSSGIERLLAMLEKFEATRADFDIFKDVEYQLCHLLKSWSNVMQDVVGEGELKPELRQAMIGDDVKLDVKFGEPEAVQTKSEVEDSVIKLMEAGLISRKEAIMKLRDVSEESAEQILSEIDEVEIGQIQESARAVPVGE